MKQKYLELKDWLSSLLDTLDDFRNEVFDDVNVVSNYSYCRAILQPEQIKENLLNDLQEIIDKIREGA